MEVLAISIQVLGAFILAILAAVQLFYPEPKRYNVISNKQEFTIGGKIYVSLFFLVLVLFFIGGYMQWRIANKNAKDSIEALAKLNNCDSLNRETQKLVHDQSDSLNEQGARINKLEGFVIGKGYNPSTLNIVTNNYSGIIQRHISNKFISYLVKKIKNKRALTGIVVKNAAPNDKESFVLRDEIAYKLKQQGIFCWDTLNKSWNHVQDLEVDKNKIPEVAYDTVIVAVNTGYYEISRTNERKDTGYTIIIYPQANVH